MSAARWGWALPLGAVLVALALFGGGCGGGSTTVTEVFTDTVEAEATTPGGTTSEETTSAKRRLKGRGIETSEVAIPPEAIRHLTSFQSPSGNIGCVLFKGDARCDIRKREWKPPPHPSSCSSEVDYGQGLTVDASGEAGFVCAGDTTLNEAAPKLAYGTGTEVDGTFCASASDGLSCVNGDGHGFFISVQRYETF